MWAGLGVRSEIVLHRVEDLSAFIRLRIEMLDHYGSSGIRIVSSNLFFQNLPVFLEPNLRFLHRGIAGANNVPETVCMVVL